MLSWSGAERTTSVTGPLQATASITVYRWLLPILCGPGKMAPFATPLAATYDPIFWPSHNTYERLWAWKRLHPDSAFSDLWKDDNSTCYGHNLHDSLPWANFLDEGRDRRYTNADLLDALPPAQPASCRTCSTRSSGRTATSSGRRTRTHRPTFAPTNYSTYAPTAGGSVAPTLSPIVALRRDRVGRDDRPDPVAPWPGTTRSRARPPRRPRRPRARRPRRRRCRRTRRPRSRRRLSYGRRRRVDEPDVLPKAARVRPSRRRADDEADGLARPTPAPHALFPDSTTEADDGDDAGLVTTSPEGGGDDDDAGLGGRRRRGRRRRRRRGAFRTTSPEGGGDDGAGGPVTTSPEGGSDDAGDPSAGGMVTTSPEGDDAGDPRRRRPGERRRGTRRRPKAARPTGQSTSEAPAAATPVVVRGARDVRATRDGASSRAAA